MSGIIVANNNETISISAPDTYGATFNISVYSNATNTWVLVNQPMTEYMDNFTIDNQTVAVAALTGDTLVTISDAINFLPGDIINIKNFYYRIKSITANVLTLHIPLMEDLVIGDIANKAGNMSLYYIQVNIPTIGEYLIRAKDSTFGLEITDSLKVVEKSIETITYNLIKL